MGYELTDSFTEKQLYAIDCYHDNKINDIKMDKNHIVTTVVLKDGTSIKMQ